jgi:hypothetical protein
MKQGDLMRAIESLVPLHEWAFETDETTGNVRWRFIFVFASVGLVKAQYVVKERGVWSIAECVRSAIAGIFELERFLLETNRLYREWKTSQIDPLPLLRRSLDEGEEPGPRLQTSARRKRCTKKGLHHHQHVHAGSQGASRNSRSYKIVLIEAARLADLMIEHDLGVLGAATHHLKGIDSDFFPDD